MKVGLLHYTPLEPIEIACSMPYNSNPSSRLVEKVWDLGHRSIARHGTISFLVTNVSVSLLTHISRHPHINLTVASSRYQDMSNREVVIPPMKEDDVQEYLNDMLVVMGIVQKWGKRKGYTKKENREISKMFLPKGSTVDMVVSGNYQGVYEFLQLRTCERAEWEIRKLANEMLVICQEKIPEIFKNCAPKCDTCKEKCI